ncbi:uncharacterized protein BDW70DRAFT_141807 [Aspergillus foveolatus]|uniref:uncharacterized protein n=1 Tax=Aspergillus foveolatus TaxID=210207 RepID=UPI003CCD95DD
MSNTPKARGQQHRRRGDTLFRKAFEFSQECDADVMLVVRLRKKGQICIFNSNDQWFPSQEDLVGIFCLSMNYTNGALGTLLSHTVEDNLARAGGEI